MANNERIVNGVKTRVLHGKDYVEVAERVNAVYKTNKEFETVESAPFEIAGRLVWRVVVRVDGKQHIGNAEVKLDAPKNTPDGTNPFECAETSAMGRALAFAGLGTVERIASFDEVARGQQFVAIVEQAQNKVVDAGNAPRQLTAANKDNQQVQPTSINRAPSVKELRKKCDEQFGPGQWDAVLAILFNAIIPDDNITPEQASQINSGLSMKATDQQIVSIKKLCQHLNKPEPEKIADLNYIVARRTIHALTVEYKASHPQNKAS